MEDREKNIRRYIQKPAVLYLLSIIDSLRDEVERLSKIEKRWDILKLNYTCYNCQSEPNCPSAWDGYNTSGDCLEEK